MYSYLTISRICHGDADPFFKCLALKLRALFFLSFDMRMGSQAIGKLSPLSVFETQPLKWRRLGDILFLLLTYLGTHSFNLHIWLLLQMLEGWSCFSIRRRNREEGAPARALSRNQLLGVFFLAVLCNASAILSLSWVSLNIFIILGIYYMLGYVFGNLDCS